MNYTSLLIAILSFTSLSFINISSKRLYNVEHVKVYKTFFENNNYDIIHLEVEKSKERIKAKYFTSNKENTISILYNKWAKDKKIICITSASYMTYVNDNRVSMGLSIDNGVINNKDLRNRGMDALVVVSPTGDIEIKNLKEKIKIVGKNSNGIPLDIRRNSMHKNYFINWCKEQKVSVFQTHLLVYNDKIQFLRHNDTYDTKRERKFLIIAKDENDKIIHTIVYSLNSVSLYNGTNTVLKFLKEKKKLHQISMINLDTGGLNILKVFNADQSENKKIRGFRNIKDAISLFVYYYKN